MSNQDKKDYYQLLNVPRDATSEQIKVSYRDLARVYHPDSNYYADIVNAPYTEKEEEMFKLITAAYDVLMDPEQRAAYDQKLDSGSMGSFSSSDGQRGSAGKPVPGWEVKITQKPIQDQKAPRGAFSRIERDYISESGAQRVTRPVSDQIQSSKKSPLELALLFIGIGLPVLTLAGVLVYMLWFADKT